MPHLLILNLAITYKVHPAILYICVCVCMLDICVCVCVCGCTHVNSCESWVSFTSTAEEGVKTKVKKIKLFLSFSLILSDKKVKNREQNLLLETHMFNHPLGLLWSYDFSLSSPLVHPKQWNHTICFQGSVLTTDKHSSDCGGNRFFFKSCCVCLCQPGALDYDRGGMHVKLCGSEGPLLAATPLEGTALSAFTQMALC